MVDTDILVVCLLHYNETPLGRAFHVFNRIKIRSHDFKCKNIIHDTAIFNYLGILSIFSSTAVTQVTDKCNDSSLKL